MVLFCLPAGSWTWRFLCCVAGWLVFFLKKNRNDRTGKGSGRRWGAGFGWGLVWGFVLAWAFSSGIFGSGVSVGKFSLVWVIWAGEWLL